MLTKKLLKLYSKTFAPPYTQKDAAVLGATILAVVGLPTMLFLNAQQIQLQSQASETQNTEPENGSLAGNITVVDDPTASGGKYIRFGTLPSPTTAPSVPVGSRVVFVGDYETGNFTQWSNCQNVYLNGSCSGIDPNRYSATIVSNGSQRQGQYGARFEVRDGDIPDFGGGERSEVRAPSVANVVEGDERWYEFSLKFDDNFQNPTGGWFIIMQWHAGSGSPPLALEVNRNGILELRNNRNNTEVHQIAPIKRGEWTDYVIHAKFSQNKSIGYVEAWENGVQKLQRTPHTTMASSSNYLKMGIYRDESNTQTHVVYQDGLRVTAP